MSSFVPREPFGGVIGRTLAESTPWWPTRPHPGEAAPNVVVILLDDLGSRSWVLRLDDRHTEHRQARGGRAAVHELPCHSGVLADAGRVGHRP